jgi:hypothetical protein
LTIYSSEKSFSKNISRVDILSRVEAPVLQFFPEYPDLQEQVSGATHWPPFLQPPVHLAESSWEAILRRAATCFCLSVCLCLFVFVLSVFTVEF